MPDKIYTLIVTSITVQADSVNVNLTSVQGPDGYSTAVEYDHPAYSSTFALLMASAINKIPLDVVFTPSDTEESTDLDVTMSFGNWKTGDNT
jgi:hypothetical protein